MLWDPGAVPSCLSSSWRGGECEPTLRAPRGALSNLVITSSITLRVKGISDLVVMDLFPSAPSISIGRGRGPNLSGAGLSSQVLGGSAFPEKPETAGSQ